MVKASLAQCSVGALATSHVAAGHQQAYTTPRVHSAEAQAHAERTRLLLPLTHAVF